MSLFLSLCELYEKLTVLCDRVAPELKSQIDSGKIDLTAIVNTHQYVFRFICFEWKYARLTDIPSHWDHAGGNDDMVRCSGFIYTFFQLTPLS